MGWLWNFIRIEYRIKYPNFVVEDMKENIRVIFVYIAANNGKTFEYSKFQIWSEYSSHPY